MGTYKWKPLGVLYSTEKGRREPVWVMAIEAACVSAGELAAVWILVAGLALPRGGDVPVASP